MDDAELKVFSAVARLRNVIGEFVIEMKANRKEVMLIVEENLDDIIAKVGDELQAYPRTGIWMEQDEDVDENYGWFVCIGLKDRSFKSRTLPGVSFFEESLEEAKELSVKLVLEFFGIWDVTQGEGYINETDYEGGG